jgi:hypothetical protein
MMLIEFPETGADTLATLAFNRKVLMVGADGKLNPITLAQVARIVVVIADTGSGVYDTEAEHRAAIARQLRETGQDGQVIFHILPLEEAAGTFEEKQFDLAVINPAAAGFANIEGPVAECDRLAKTVVVLDDGTPDLYERVCIPLRSRPGVVTRDNALIIARAAVEIENGV